MSCGGCIDRVGTHDVRRETPALVVLHELVASSSSVPTNTYGAPSTSAARRARNALGDTSRGCIAMLGDPEVLHERVEHRAVEAGDAPRTIATRSSIAASLQSTSCE